MTKSVIFLTAPYIHKPIRDYCFKRLLEVSPYDVILTKQPEDWPLCHESLYKNMLMGLAGVTTDKVFICEHDCIYTTSYFNAVAEYTISYSTNIAYLTREGFIQRNRKNGTLSTMYGDTEAIRTAITAKLQEARDNKLVWAEPNNGYPIRPSAMIFDIRHGDNFTGNREGELYGINTAKELWSEIDG